MITARDALVSIERADQGLRQDEDRLTKVIEAVAAKIAHHRSEQAQLFKALAAIRLDALKQNQIQGNLDAAESRAMAQLKEQQHKLDALTARRGTLQDELSAAKSQREDIAKRVADAVDAIAAQEEATEARIADDVEWQAQSARMTGAQMRAEAAEEKAQKSEADRDEKSRPYLADNLFVYLWKRHYGTSSYHAGPIARMGDAFVARVIKYETARQNYFALTEIPKRLREHADRLKVEAVGEEEKLVELERKALEADGITDLEAAHDQAVAELQTTEERIASLEEEDIRLEKQRIAFLGTDDGHGLGGVLSDLAASMQREDLRVLLRQALETPTREDEKIVRQLQVLEEEVERREREAREARETAVTLAKKRAELERSRDDFRRSGYDRRGGSFNNEALLGDILGGIIGGVLTSRELRDALRSGYRYSGQRPSWPTRPRGGGFGGGWRSGGGGFGGGGASGGGGFKTGGGF